MIPNQGIILCAGMGTRMGVLSQFYPKPLLPLFNKRLIDLQVESLKKMGVAHIYINSHFKSELVEDYMNKNHPEVKILFEPTLLGSGGVFHNLKVHGLRGKILAVNADSFYHLDRAFFQEIATTDRHILFGLNIGKDDNYNRLKLDKENHLLEILPPEKDGPPITFSGVSIINLDIIQYRAGVSSFFESVCIPQEGSTMVKTPMKSTFWDFGTFADYVKNSIKLLETIKTKHRVFSDSLSVEMGLNFCLSGPSVGPEEGVMYIPLSEEQGTYLKIMTESLDYSVEQF